MVRWMFAQRLAGHSVARIARALNEAGVPCPSAADPARNPHRDLARVDAAARSPRSWQNPRYTGGRCGTGSAPTLELADPGNYPRAQAGPAVEPARGLGHLEPARAPGAGQRGRLHRRPGRERRARPGPAGQSGAAAVPAGRAAGLRRVRAADGIGLVQRQARVPVPARPYQRDGTGPGPAEEHLRPRGQAPAAPARPAPASHHPRYAGPAPNPRRCRCQACCEPGRGARRTCASMGSPSPGTRPPRRCKRAPPADAKPVTVKAS